jgi:valyl-tRNA synthetase
MTQTDSTREIPKAYDPSKAEAPIYQMWMDRGYFKPNFDAEGARDRDPFCIIMPPPNVTGELHLGHALTATIEDTLIRWHRMRGDPALWLPGVDHAGIATQNVVERELAKEGMSRHDLGRDQFVERVWQWVRQVRSRISHQHMRLGASCDWDREVFTMDDGPQKAVRTTFVNLYNDGLIYKGERIINWCPRCQTALSDLEVEHEDVESNLWHVRYPVLDDAGNPTDDYVQIATTRPETIVADVAVAVNPTVERWMPFVGRKVLLPVIERHIPVIADDVVDPEFGTGALKITPGHDPVDFEIGERHGLPSIVAIAQDATMNEEAGPYNGVDRFEARKLIVADLERLGLLEKIEPHTHSIGHCSRCNTVVEPVASEQWFVKMAPLAAPAIEAVKDGRIEIVPRRFERVYMNWMENIRDWCISRQLWWGHRIPVWYCGDCGQRIAAVDDPSACTECGSSKLEQDPDVLDTWFSSGLWPHSTLGWPEQPDDLRTFYPTSVLETGYDILFFWVARMITMGLYNMNDVPFRHVYLHGLIRDAQGRKMTKSLGNVVDPLVAADQYGTDALRFTLATGGAPGNDFRLFDEKLESSRNFANKMWNAARFVIQSIGDKAVFLPDASNDARKSWPLEDRWIYSRLIATIDETNKLLSEFQINEAGRALYEFFWSEFCDWYLEMAKVRLKAGDESPLPVLADVLQNSLRLLHPMIPFVTENLWQHLRDCVQGLAPEALIVAPYPQAVGNRDIEAEEQVRAVTLEPVPKVRDDLSSWPRSAVKSATVKVAPNPDLPFADRERIKATLVEATATNTVMTGTASWTYVDSIGTDQSGLFGVTPHLRYVVLADESAMKEQRAKLEKEVAAAETDVKRLEGKLGNEQFTSKAPPAVVEKERERLSAAQARVAGLRERLAELD